MKNLRKKLAGKKTKLAQLNHKEHDHPARLDNYQNGSFFNVDINLIIPDPDQPRKYFNPDSLSELSHSIQQQGVLQPVIIRRNKDNQIYLVAGERRFRAAKMAGLAQVPAILTTGNPSEIALIENMQRENLNPIEEAEGLNRLMQDHNYTQQQLADIVGKAKSTISEALSINNLPDDIKDKVRRAELSKRVLIEVAKQETASDMFFLLEQIEKDNLKSTQIRKLTRKKINKQISASALFNKTTTLTKQLSHLDITSFDNTDKHKLTIELQKLRNLLDDFLTRTIYK